MKLSSLLREASRDVLTGTTRFTTLTASLSLLVCGLILGDSIAIANQIKAANTFRDAGGATLIIEAASSIDGRACQRLATIPGVRASGALRPSANKVTTSSLPNAPVPAYDVSDGFPELLSATRIQKAGLVVSDDVAKTLGLVAGDVVSTTEGDVPIAATYPYPSDGRRPGFGYATLAITSDQRPFDECWAAAWPQVTNLRALLLTTITPEILRDDERPVVSQLNSTLGADFSGSDSYFTRMTRLAGPITGLLAFFVGYLAIRLRRLQLASALHSGVSRSDLACIHLLEASAWAIPAAIIGVGAASTAAQSVPAGDASSILLNGLCVALASFVGAILGTLTATLSTREKRLFRYFKDR